MDTNNSANALAARAGLDVRITRVESIPLRVPLKTPVKLSSGPARPTVDVMLVRLHTDAGVVGVGETQAWRRQGNAAGARIYPGRRQDPKIPREFVGRKSESAFRRTPFTFTSVPSANLWASLC